METQGIAPVPPFRPLQSVTGDRRGGSGGGGFERAFRQQNEADDGSAELDDDRANDSAPRELQPRKPGIRKDQDRDDRQIDVVV